MIQQMTQNLLTLTSNPLFQRAKEMAQGKNENELRQIALNICKEKGLDLDSAYNMFQQQFKGIVPLNK